MFEMWYIERGCEDARTRKEGTGRKKKKERIEKEKGYFDLIRS